MDKNTPEKNQKKTGVEQPLLLKVSDVSRVLRLSTSTVYRLLGHRRSGGIPVKKFGRALRISLSDLRQWVENYPNTTRKDGPQSQAQEGSNGSV